MHVTILWIRSTSYPAKMGVNLGITERDEGAKLPHSQPGSSGNRVYIMDVVRITRILDVRALMAD